MDELEINSAGPLKPMNVFNPSEAISNKLYWGKLGIVAKGIIFILLVALAVITTFLVNNFVIKIFLFIALIIGLVYAVYFPFVLLPKRRQKNLERLKEEMGGEIHEPEERSRGYSTYVIWAGDYKGYPVDIEETFEGHSSKGVYHNIYKVKMEMHKQFELRRCTEKSRDASNPDLVGIMGIKLIITSRNNKPQVTEYFFDDEKKLAKLISFLEIVGEGDLQGRWISMGVRTDNLTVARADFEPQFVKRILDYLIELGEEMRELKVTKSSMKESMEEWKVGE